MWFWPEFRFVIHRNRNRPISYLFLPLGHLSNGLVLDDRENGALGLMHFYPFRGTSEPTGDTINAVTRDTFGFDFERPPHQFPNQFVRTGQRIRNATE